MATLDLARQAVANETSTLVALLDATGSLVADGRVGGTPQVVNWSGRVFTFETRTMFLAGDPVRELGEQFIYRECDSTALALDVNGDPL